MIVLGGACAPEPTEIDTSVDLSGVWTSNAHLFFLSQISMKLVQEQKGVVSGTWTLAQDSVAIAWFTKDRPTSKALAEEIARLETTLGRSLDSSVETAS